VRKPPETMAAGRPIRKSRVRRLLRPFFACVVLLLVCIFVEAAMGWRCHLTGKIPLPQPQPLERKAATAGIQGYLRPEDDTYLSYPEWYIVWSYQEKADFQEKRLPSGFPYFGAVRQYWSSYCCISRLTRGKYNFNAGEQIMLVVIGSSFSAEYTLKGAYENTIGRLSEWSAGHQPVEEDQYAYKVAREYADFVHIRPFYEFHLAPHVKGLWKETRLWGPHPVRKWERKAFLTLDYTVEAFYCWLIEKMTHVTYGYEPSDTYAWVDNTSAAAIQRVPRLKVVKQTGPQAFIVDLPRYQEFTGLSQALAERDIHFVEIAGNSQILVSVLAPQSWDYKSKDAQSLFSTPVLTRPEIKRFVLGCDVRSLHAFLNAMRAEKLSVEHIYDY
jgi:hypothetical protein